MTDEQIRQAAKMIAWDEGPYEHSWESIHSCGMGRYGCCGGGKDIDREALTASVESALRAARDAGRREALREAAEDAEEMARKAGDEPKHPIGKALAEAKL